MSKVCYARDLSPHYKGACVYTVSKEERRDGKTIYEIIRNLYGIYNIFFQKFSTI